METLATLTEYTDRAESNRYNGWSNYATWRINLELVDDYVSSQAEDGETYPDTDTLAEVLAEMVDEALTNYGEDTDGLALSYARAFVSDVNFHEIADAHAEDLVRANDDDTDDDD